MSADCAVPTAQARRRGIALLFALVMTVVVATCGLALWRSNAAAIRATALESAVPAASALSDSTLFRAAGQLDAGAWRALTLPAQHLELESGTARRSRWRATLARMSWSTLLIRASSQVSSGVPLVDGRADRRLLVPLIAPMPLPANAITGVVPWTVDAGADLAVTAATAAEQACRGGVVPGLSGSAAFSTPLDTLALPTVDPDTVSVPLVGAFRLSTAVLRTPLRVTGMVVSGIGLRLDADLHVMGVLAVGGSVQTGIGRLDVTGAVVTGDVGGAHSGLGAGDRVHYDACAIRHAVAPVTRPGAAATWTSLTLH
ncbi:MAG TPA: hypothetical protein VE861_11450 [Gemmatimonadaceae bacterium]|nr:hypothetical protein [Gemmatimonadaceae bacterium]